MRRAHLASLSACAALLAGGFVPSATAQPDDRSGDQPVPPSGSPPPESAPAVAQRALESVEAALDGDPTAPGQPAA